MRVYSLLWKRHSNFIHLSLVVPDTNQGKVNEAFAIKSIKNRRIHFIDVD